MLSHSSLCAAFSILLCAVELLPEDQWRGPSNKLPAGAAAGGDAAAAADGDEEAEPAPEGAHIAQVDPGEHYGEDAAAAGGAAAKRPTAKVVGIIRRNWRTRGYCGSLQVRVPCCAQ